MNIYTYKQASTIPNLFSTPLPLHLDGASHHIKSQKNPSFIQACLAIFSIFHCSEQTTSFYFRDSAPPGRVSRPSPTPEEKRTACGRQMRGEGERNVPGIDLGGSGTWRGRRETGEMKSGSQSRISRDTEPGKHQFS